MVSGQSELPATNLFWAGWRAPAGGHRPPAIMANCRSISGTFWPRPRWVGTHGAGRQVLKHGEALFMPLLWLSYSTQAIATRQARDAGRL